MPPKAPIHIAICLTLPSSAALASEYQGSNAMEHLINSILQLGYCGDGDCLAQGSVLGEVALTEGRQQTAPMNTPFRQGFCDKNFSNAQIAIGTDQTLVLNNNGDRDRRALCDTSMVADLPFYTSDIPAWGEALQLIYGGDQGRGDEAACLHFRRLKLINNWHQIWTDPCTTGECTKLRMAFRPEDRSGTTRFFKKLLGIQAFCNGAQHEDKDPLRTDCADTVVSGGIDYCPDGNLGVVQAIDLPTKKHSFTRMTPCAAGNFQLKLAPFGVTECLDGPEPFGGFLCMYPRDCDDQPGCVNSSLNTSPHNPFMDGRAYNLLHIDSTLAPFRLPYPDSENHDPERDDLTTKTSYSHAPLYLNGKCSQSNAIERIACLTANIDCSIGFGSSAMLKATETKNSFGEACNTSTPVVHTSILLDGQAPGSASYPIPRNNLYYSTLGIPVYNGVPDCTSIVNAGEKALCQCIFDEPSILNNALSSSGFEPIPGGPKMVRCGE